MALRLFYETRRGRGYLQLLQLDNRHEIEIKEEVDRDLLLLSYFYTSVLNFFFVSISFT